MTPYFLSSPSLKPFFQDWGFLYLLTRFHFKKKKPLLRFLSHLWGPWAVVQQFSSPCTPSTFATRPFIPHSLKHQNMGLMGSGSFCMVVPAWIYCHHHQSQPDTRTWTALDTQSRFLSENLLVWSFNCRFYGDKKKWLTLASWWEWCYVWLTWAYCKQW